MDFAIENGRVFTGGGFLERNIGILGGRIAQVSKSRIRAEEDMDARGLIVLPGFIDPHVHLREPGAEHKEDFYTGTCAAANGGYTAVIDMPNAPVPTDSVRRLEDKIRLAERKAVVDFSLHFGAREGNLPEIGALTRSVPVKFYLDGSQNLFMPAGMLPEYFRKVAEKGLLACVHAEDAKLLEKGKERCGDRPVHSLMRSVEAERKAVSDAIAAARPARCRLHVCHVSSKAGLGEIRKAGAGASGPENAGASSALTCEVAPHHLFLTEKDYVPLMKVNPPLRSASDAAALWEGLVNGSVDCIASDHAPHTLEEKEQEYWHAPSGVPGLDTTLKLMLTKVNQRVLTLERLVELCSSNPARIFGFAGKGEIAVGKDADFTVIDLKREGIIRPDGLMTKCGWSPYEGFAYRGCPAKTVVRGALVMDEGDIVGRKGTGIFWG